MSETFRLALALVTNLEGFAPFLVGITLVLF
jgi:uncharacterized protein YjeT (DUF2065 family)